MCRVNVAMIAETMDKASAGMFLRTFRGNNRTTWSQFIN